MVSKVLEKCIYNRCYDSISGTVHKLQHGFLQGRNCTTQLIQVYHKILTALDNTHSVDVIYLDFQKAFDKVSHRLLLCKLRKHGFHGSLYNWLKSYLTGGVQRVALEGHYSEWIEVTSGVPQGSILGPLLFILYINDFPEQVNPPTEMALYADDSKLYRVIKSYADTGNLQNDLNELKSWTEKWCMKFNTNKCKVMRLSRKKIQTTNGYKLGHESLECVKTTKDLGITVSADVSWGTHISKITAKANRTLGLIKRTCKDFEDQTIRKLLYLTLVRPQLEFSSELWSPSEVKYQLMLEGVQRRASKFILNYPADIDYKERLIKLKLLPLDVRRNMKDLLFFFKCRAGLLDIQLLDYVQNRPASKYNIRSYDVNNFNDFKCRTQYFKNSYFPRVITKWNSLDSELKTICSFSLFKSKLYQKFHRELNVYQLPHK